MNCGPENLQEANSSLLVTAADSLLAHNSSFTGMELMKQSADSQQSLLSFSQTVDLLLTDTEVLDVHIQMLTAILQFAYLKSLRVDGFISSRSHTNCAMLAVECSL